MSSPSAVAKVKGCARKVALDLFEPYVQGPEAALGDEVHEVADDYHKIGKAPDLTTTAGLMLEAALPYMPAPRTGTAEGKVRWDFLGQIHNFRMDLNGFVRDLPKALPEADPGMPYVLDYKTQKDKGGKEKDQQLWGKAAFLADEEAILYALRRMSDTGAGRCYLRWLYIRGPQAPAADGTPGRLRPRAIPSDVIVTWDEAMDAYRRTYAPYAAVVDGIYQARDKKHLTVVSAMCLPPNPFQCTRYGVKYPCSHMSKCQLDPAFVMVETSKEERYTMQLQGTDLFAAMQAAMGATPAPAPSNPAPVVNPAAFATATPVQAAPVIPITAAPTIPSSPAFVNPPEAPHVPKAEPTPVSDRGPGEYSHAPAGIPTDAEIGRVVRFLFGR